MPITFKGKNIQDLYKSGTKNIITNALTTEKAPENQFEKNFANGININGTDINEQAISQYIDYTSGNNIYINNVGYKHISLYGRTNAAGYGGSGSDCNNGRHRGGGAGGPGGIEATYGILKHPINGSNLNINFTTSSTIINIGNTNFLTANNGQTGGRGNDAGKNSDGFGGKKCANSGNQGDRGANGAVICNTGTTVPLPTNEGRKNFVRIYFHYE